MSNDICKNCGHRSHSHKVSRAAVKESSACDVDGCKCPKFEPLPSYNDTWAQPQLVSMNWDASQEFKNDGVVAIFILNGQVSVSGRGFNHAEVVAILEAVRKKIE